MQTVTGNTVYCWRANNLNTIKFYVVYRAAVGWAADTDNIAKLLIEVESVENQVFEDKIFIRLPCRRDTHSNDLSATIRTEPNRFSDCPLDRKCPSAPI